MFSFIADAAGALFGGGEEEEKPAELTSAAEPVYNWFTNSRNAGNSHVLYHTAEINKDKSKADFDTRLRWYLNSFTSTPEGRRAWAEVMAGKNPDQNSSEGQAVIRGKSRVAELSNKTGIAKLFVDARYEREPDGRVALGPDGKPVEKNGGVTFWLLIAGLVIGGFWAAWRLFLYVRERMGRKSSGRSLVPGATVGAVRRKARGRAGRPAKPTPAKKTGGAKGKGRGGIMYVPFKSGPFKGRTMADLNKAERAERMAWMRSKRVAKKGGKR